MMKRIVASVGLALAVSGCGTATHKDASASTARTACLQVPSGFYEAQKSVNRAGATLTRDPPAGKATAIAGDLTDKATAFAGQASALSETTAPDDVQLGHDLLKASKLARADSKRATDGTATEADIHRLEAAEKAVSGDEQKITAGCRGTG